MESPRVSEEHSWEAEPDLEEAGSPPVEPTLRVLEAPVTSKNYPSRVPDHFSTPGAATSIRVAGLAVETEMVEVRFSPRPNCPVVPPSPDPASGKSDPNLASSHPYPLTPVSTESALPTYPIHRPATVERLVTQCYQDEESMFAASEVLEARRTSQKEESGRWA